MLNGVMVASSVLPCVRSIRSVPGLVIQCTDCYQNRILLEVVRLTSIGLDKRRSCRAHKCYKIGRSGLDYSLENVERCSHFVL